MAAMPRPTKVAEPAPVNSTYEPMPMPTSRPAARARARSEHAPVAADGRAEGDLLVTCVTGRLEVLRAVLDPFHRRVEAAGDPRQQDVLRIDADLLPESAAHIRRDHTHLVPKAFRYRIGNQ